MSFKYYVARRIVWAVFATWLMLTVTFFMLEVAPDSKASFAFSAASSGGNVSEARQTYDLIRGNTGSLFARYSDWMLNFMGIEFGDPNGIPVLNIDLFEFDWGYSRSANKPVTDVIADAYPYSVQYGFPAALIAIVLGYGIGLYSATHQYTVRDYAATFFAFFGISIPNFWFAIILILLFSVKFGIPFYGQLPVYYHTSVIQDHGFLSLENAEQLVLPVIVLSTASIAGNMRYSRATALEYVEAEFVKTAKAKGASGRRILSRHILRPAAVPLMTIFISDVLNLFLASSYLIEVVFQIPGLAKMNYDAIIAQDTSLVMGTSVVFLFIALMSVLLQDVAYTVLDPRIDYGDR